MWCVRDPMALQEGKELDRQQWLALKEQQKKTREILSAQVRFISPTLCVHSDAYKSVQPSQHGQTVLSDIISSLTACNMCVCVCVAVCR